MYRPLRASGATGRSDSHRRSRIYSGDCGDSARGTDRERVREDVVRAAEVGPSLSQCPTIEPTVAYAHFWASDDALKKKTQSPANSSTIETNTDMPSCTDNLLNKRTMSQTAIARAATTTRATPIPITSRTAITQFDGSGASKASPGGEPSSVTNRRPAQRPAERTVTPAISKAATLMMPGARPSVGSSIDRRVSRKPTKNSRVSAKCTGPA